MNNTTDPTITPTLDNKWVRYSWATYHLLVLFSSLIGDSLVLYASSCRKALKVHPIIVTVIQHIAVSDLAVVLLRVLPRIISFFANSWILGDVTCSLTAYANPVFFYAGTYFVAVLTTSKLLILKNPIGAVTWSRQRAHHVCSVFWVLSLLYPVFLHTAGSNLAHFDIRIYSCRYVTERWDTASLVLTYVLMVVPAVIIIGTTVPALRYLALARQAARRARGVDPWHGTLTVSLTAIFYLISNFPLFVYYICKHFFSKPDSARLFRIGIYCLSINVVSNFYIYALTIRSFRRYLRSCWYSWLVRLGLRDTSGVLDKRGSAGQVTLRMLTKTTIISLRVQQSDDIVKK
ncbi:hypothetical protein ACHWQZ_G014589 [Mnemiopsis leidyi]